MTGFATDELAEVHPCYSLIFRRTSRHPASRVWRAITDSDEVTRWMTYPARIDLRVGGDYFVDFARTDGGDLDGMIVKLEPGRILRYVWGTSVVEWVLEPGEPGSSYTFAQYGLHPRPIPEEEGLAAGWHVWLEDLDQFIDTGSPSAEALGAERWRAVGKLYRPKLEAAVTLVPTELHRPFEAAPPSGPASA